MKKQEVKKTDTVSVIMPSYKTGPILLRAIESVLRQRNLHELIIIDNGNSNYVRSKLNEVLSANPNVKVLAGHGNIGFARACNIGAKEASGDYILFLSPNCILSEDVIAKVLLRMKKDSKAWLAGVRLINQEGDVQPGTTGNIVGFKNLMAEWLRIYKIFNCQRITRFDSEMASESFHVPSIARSFMLIKRDKYEEIGGMNKEYFFTMESMDLCHRINEMGGYVLFLNNISVVHYRGMNEVSKYKVARHKARDMVRYFFNNYKGAYIPGSLYIIALIIYTRFLFKISAMWIKSLFDKNNDSPITRDVPKEQIKSFLESYINFVPKSNRASLMTAQYFNNRSPILLSDADSQLGIAILRRLLAANVTVIALYKNMPVDMYHPKLTWLKGELGSDYFNLYGMEAKTLVCTTPIWEIPPKIDYLMKAGIKRIISFSDFSIMQDNVGLMPNELSARKKKIIAEQDIARICGQKGVVYTVLRTSLTYGLGMNDAITRLYKFFARYGYFPRHLTVKDGVLKPVHVDDLAIAAIQILNSEKTYNNKYNLVGNERLSVRDIAEKIQEFVMDDETGGFFSRSVHKLQKVYLKLFERYDEDLWFSKYMVDKKLSSDAANDDFGFDARPFLSDGKDDLRLGA